MAKNKDNAKKKTGKDKKNINNQAENKIQEKVSDENKNNQAKN